MPHHKNKAMPRTGASTIGQESSTPAPATPAAPDQASAAHHEGSKRAASSRDSDAAAAAVVPPSTPPHADRILKSATPKQPTAAQTKKGGRKKQLQQQQSAQLKPHEASVEQFRALEVLEPVVVVSADGSAPQPLVEWSQEEQAPVPLAQQEEQQEQEKEVTEDVERKFVAQVDIGGEQTVQQSPVDDRRASIQRLRNLQQLNKQVDGENTRLKEKHALQFNDFNSEMGKQEDISTIDTNGKQASPMEEQLSVEEAQSREKNELLNILVQQLQMEKSSLEKQVQQENGRVCKAEAEVNHLNQQIQQQQEDHKKITNELQYLIKTEQAQHILDTEKIHKLQLDLDTIRTENDQLQALLKKHEDSASIAEKQLQEVKMAAQREQTQSQTNIQHLESKLLTMQQEYAVELQRQRDQTNGIQERFTKLQLSFEEKEEELAVIRKQVPDLEQQLRNQSKHMEERIREWNQKENEFAALKQNTYKELSELVTKIEHLEQEKSEFAKRINELENDAKRESKEYLVQLAKDALAKTTAAPSGHGNKPPSLFEHRTSGIAVAALMNMNKALRKNG